MTQTVLVAHRCFSCCWAVPESRTLLFLTLPHHRTGWGGTQPGQLAHAGQRDLPHHAASCSATKTGGKKKERVLQGGGICFPKTYNAYVLLSWKWLNICVLMGSSEWIPVLLCLCAQLLLYLLYCLDPWVFSFLPSDSLPHPTGRGEQTGVWAYLPASVSPQQPASEEHV